MANITLFSTAHWQRPFILILPISHEREAVNLPYFMWMILVLSNVTILEMAVLSNNAYSEMNWHTEQHYSFSILE